MLCRLFLLLSCLLCTSAAGRVEFGANVPDVVAIRIASLLSAAPFTALQFTVSCGNTSAVRSLIPSSELAALGDEGFIVRSDGSNMIFVADGNVAGYALPGVQTTGASFACYTLLETVFGFRFLHPLQPSLPVAPIQLPVGSINVIERKPRWSIRGLHYHTEHPLELTELLNGMDSGHVSESHYESWDSMLPSWSLVLEWLVANRQNRIEWLLLCATEWTSFCLSPERSSRLSRLTSLARQWGIAPGSDVAIAIRQQHAMHMVNTSTGDSSIALKEIRANIDFLSDAGFSFLSTESGFSEFTHGSDVTMLSWMNETANYAVTKKMKAYIKCHCSTGQVCKNFKDPDTGLPLNFNFLPIYATTNMGIMPHTVQMYTVDDPTPTYGNDNFTYMFDFMFRQAGGQREVVYHPETAYWVNYDIDVPLFLPAYASARVHDLRRVASQEIKTGHAISGQITFDSGWEWGYWFQDVINARATWNPCVECATDADATAHHLSFVCDVFGATVKSRVVDILTRLMEAQHNLLVLGVVNGSAPPADIIKHNGQAYLEGWDTFAEIGVLSPHALATQPDKLGLLECRIPTVKPSYASEIRPLLAAMNDTFSKLAQELHSLVASVHEQGTVLFQELLDALDMLALRSSEVYALYDYSCLWDARTKEWLAARRRIAEDNIASAGLIVASREKAYRVSADRIAGWRANPTAYHYGYLWTARSLYYFWRDYGQAVMYKPEVFSPCYQNIINPADVGLGEGTGGIFVNVTELLRELAHEHKLDFLGDCASEPNHELHFPDDL